MTAEKRDQVQILPGTADLESRNGIEHANVLDSVTPGVNGLPPEVLFFGEIWISPAGDLIPLTVQVPKAT